MEMVVFPDSSSSEDETEYTYVLSKGKLLGFASYHLQVDGDSYINYENVPSDSPDYKTDDGAKFPAIKLFTNQSFDLKSRKFSGSILWKDAPVKEAVRWDITMLFSEDWSGIVAGKIQSYRGELKRKGVEGIGELTRKFGRDLCYVRYDPDKD